MCTYRVGTSREIRPLFGRIIRHDLEVPLPASCKRQKKLLSLISIECTGIDVFDGHPNAAIGRRQFEWQSKIQDAIAADCRFDDESIHDSLRKCAMNSPFELYRVTPR